MLVTDITTLHARISERLGVRTEEGVGTFNARQKKLVEEGWQPYGEMKIHQGFAYHDDGDQYPTVDIFQSFVKVT